MTRRNGTMMYLNSVLYVCVSIFMYFLILLICGYIYIYILQEQC